MLEITAIALTAFLAGWIASQLMRKTSAAAEGSSVAPVATVTHELRTPITGVVGMTDLLLSTELSPEQTTYVRAIRGSAETMHAIVSDLLDVAAIEAGQFTQSSNSFAPDKLVAEIVELLAPHAQAKGLDIAGHVSPEVPALLIGDAQRLRQILINLVGNAVKYTSTGGVGLRADPTPTGVVFSVHDTGPGIPEGDIRRLFGRFQRGTDAQATGTGLGLSIARHLAERLGGKLDLHSVVGHGSTFTVSLPFAVDAESTLQEPWLRETAALVAAASPFEAPWLAEELGIAGADVALAATADMAENEMDLHHWPVIFVDQQMRDDLSEALSRAAAQGSRVITLITPADRRASGTQGEYLMRPVRAQSLRDLLSRMPAPAPQKTEPPVVPVALTPVGPAPKRRRALLAEDDGVNALLVRTRLEYSGWRVTAVGDGEAAVEAFNEACGDDPFELAVLDLEMPKLSGFDTAAAIRRIEAAFGAQHHIPVVVVTAADLPPLQEQAHGYGVDAVLSKPFDPDALKAVLSSDALKRAG
jgi:CheY-like chemotaxis protein/nitrogen-specific signal transduction histidine kinase